jgi:hypothetical protein
VTACEHPGKFAEPAREPAHERAQRTAALGEARTGSTEKCLGEIT